MGFIQKLERRQKNFEGSSYQTNSRLFTSSVIDTVALYDGLSVRFVESLIQRPREDSLIEPWNEVVGRVVPRQPTLLSPLYRPMTSETT